MIALYTIYLLCGLCNIVPIVRAFFISEVQFNFTYIEGMARPEVSLSVLEYTGIFTAMIITTYYTMYINDFLPVINLTNLN